MVVGEYSLKFQLPSYNGLVLIMSSRLGGKGPLNELGNKSINDNAVCRTGLLKIYPGLDIFPTFTNLLICQSYSFLVQAGEG